MFKINLSKTGLVQIWLIYADCVLWMTKIGELKTGDQGRKHQELEKIKKNTSSEKMKNKKTKNFVPYKVMARSSCGHFWFIGGSGRRCFLFPFTSLGQIFLPVEIYDHPGWHSLVINHHTTVVITSISIFLISHLQRECEKSCVYHNVAITWKSQHKGPWKYL